MIIGNNFQRLYSPCTQSLESMIFTINGDLACVRKMKDAYTHQKIEFTRSKRGEEQIVPTQREFALFIDEVGIKEQITTQQKDLCRELYSEDPLKFWDKDKSFAKIELIDSKTVIRVKQMVYTYKDQQEFKEQIDELLKKGLIRESKSPHSSPAFMVRNHAEEKRGKARMVINYKKLNDNTVFDGYYIPNKTVLFNRIQGATWFSKMDCKSGYWQVKMDKDSIPLTAFSAPQGHYEWVVMPFGLKNAPQIFQRRMDKIFKDLKHCCLVYIDDILIFSKTLEQHMHDLKAITQECINHGIVLGQTKCIYAVPEIEFLGLKIKAGEIVLQDHILEKVEKFPDVIENRKQLERFLGCLTYASDFIKNLAKLRKPLQSKLKKEEVWTWSSQDTKIVRELKKCCMNLPVLTLPNEDDELVLETDASNYHWGVVLKIKKDNKLCRYSSGSFNKAECNYTVMEKEILAILKGINKFIIFLAPKPFTVRTDCKGILGFIQNNLDNMKAQGRLLRWQLALNQFSFNIEHVQG